MRKKIRLNESQLQNFIRESVNNVLKEYSGHDFATNSTINKNRVNSEKFKRNFDRFDNGILHQQYVEKMQQAKRQKNQKRFIPIIKNDIETLHSMYEKWQYSRYKPEGIDDIIDAILNVKLMFEDLLPESDNLGPYENEPYNFWDND